MSEKDFIESLKEINIIPTDTQLLQLKKYYNLLIEWNQKINLTRITNEKDVYLKHFYDSLTITKVVDLNTRTTLLDFGTGAGFPGMVLKIMYPSLKITLIDSLKKRTIFLNEVVKELDLKDIEVVHCRIEDYPLKKFDIITTRAVANLSKLLDYTHKLIDNNTKFIPLKGHVDDEIELAKTKLNKYNLQIVTKEEFNLPVENSTRTILIIEKKKNN